MLDTYQPSIHKQGVFKCGWGKNADGQKKKHVKQMSHSEKDYLTYLLRDIQYSFRIHPHLQDKQHKGLVSFDILTIQKTLRSPSLINFIREYSEVTTYDGTVDKRVLVRSPKRERVYIKNKGYVLCNLLFVVSIDTSQIITAYYSHKNHRYTINEARYDEALAIM